jgi:excisionase family DNA binding protein
MRQCAYVNAETALSTAQAAELLGVSRVRVRQLAVAGVLECQRTPLGRLFDEAHVRMVAERRRERAQHDERIALPERRGSGPWRPGEVRASP